MIGSLQVVKLSMIITTISQLQFSLALPSLIELLIVSVIIGHHYFTDRTGPEHLTISRNGTDGTDRTLKKAKG